MVYKDMWHIVLKGTMDRTIRVRLKEEQFKKYKVFCAINEVSMTDQTNKIVREFIEKQNEMIKIVSVCKT